MSAGPKASALPRLAEQLNRLGYDVLSCRAAGNHNRGLSDSWQLEFAAQAGRTILIHNIIDYALISLSPTVRPSSLLLTAA